ncbi:hypothetical protein GCM10010176_076040 [Nonomuraea spiralis]|nr:hypothetical protein GCM10010176_076040 [Nonomuraea spiralis]
MGAFRSSDRPMSVIGAAPVLARSSPGTLASNIEPGEKPSFLFHSPGAIGTPAAETGVEPADKATLRPVAVPRSATVNQSFGNGSRQAAGSMGSQPDGSGAADAGDAGGVVSVAQARARTVRRRGRTRTGTSGS